jgi:thiosulfate dehydrogenase
MPRWTRAFIAVVLASAVGGMRGQTPAPAWPVQDVDALPEGAWRDTVRRGRDLFTATYRFIGPEVARRSARYAGNNLSCENCHLQGGTQRWALPMIGVYGLYPTYAARENEIRTLEERINGCVERSLNGRPLASDAPEMKALVAYVQFLSTGVPVGLAVEGHGTPALPLLERAANPTRGTDIFIERCVSCHQANGQGLRRRRRGDAAGYQYPPLWGSDSFNDGAGMHRLIASASFIHANMPFGTPYGTPGLSIDDAWDVAAYINSQPRPSRPHLERDYPDRTRKPVDAPFPPFVDEFPLEQHRLGPFRPILDAQADHPRRR